MVLSRHFRSTQECVLFPGRYKPTLGRLPPRVSSFQNSTIGLISSTSLNTMPPVRTFDNHSFYPFPIDYSSETFAPLVHTDQQISHVRYLLRGQPAAMARFQHYLTTCSTIFALEQTLQDLRNSRDYVFAKFVTPDVVHRL